MFLRGGLLKPDESGLRKLVIDCKAYQKCINTIFDHFGNSEKSKFNGPLQINLC